MAALFVIFFLSLLGGCVNTGHTPTYIISHEEPEEVVIEEEVR